VGEFTTVHLISECLLRVATRARTDAVETQARSFPTFIHCIAHAPVSVVISSYFRCKTCRQWNEMWSSSTMTSLFVAITMVMITFVDEASPAATKDVGARSIDEETVLAMIAQLSKLRDHIVSNRE